TLALRASGPSLTPVPQQSDPAVGEGAAPADLALSSGIGWPARRQMLLAFLDLPDAQPPPGDVGRFVGSCECAAVRLAQEDLYAHDLPDRWHRLRLVPLGGGAFEVESP